MILVKCRFCRGSFERPDYLEPWLPAIACGSVACQALLRDRVAELERKQRIREASIPKHRAFEIIDSMLLN